MNFSKKTLAFLILIGILISIGIHVAYVKVWSRCEGQCYQINQVYEFKGGGYPRMTQVDDLLLVAYTNGSFVLDGINLSTAERVGPIEIINSGINPARSTLFYAEDLGIVICVFNHDNAASCGIAWASKGQVLNASAWTIQLTILGPVYQDFFHVGLWEPYLAPYNSSTFLLYVSNQTVYDPNNPIDVEHYSFTLEGYEVVQKIEIHWTKWNGTGFETSYCGVASQNLPDGGPIHYKDGMASSVLISGNATHKDYLMTFEAFAPPAKIPRITMVRLQISETGVQTLWRREITHVVETAPFITSLNGTIITSYKYQAVPGPANIAFIGLKPDQSTYSKPISLKTDIYGWPSIYSDEDQLWVAGTNTTNGKVTILELNLDFTWKTKTIPYNLILLHPINILVIIFALTLFLLRQAIFSPNQFFTNLLDQEISPSSFLPITCFTLLSGFGFASFTHFEQFDLLFPLACGFILLLWIYYSGFSYGLGRLLKLKAKYMKTIELTQYFFIPLLVFFFALNAVLSLVGPEMLWFYFTIAFTDISALIIVGLVAGGFFLWFVVLAIIGISKNYQTSWRKATVIIFIPVALLLLLLYWLIDVYLLTLIPL